VHEAISFPRGDKLIFGRKKGGVPLL